MSLIDRIREAGIVGAGGAGFPAHVKLDCKTEYLIANGAECEPLLRVDRRIMERYARDIVRAIGAVAEHTGAKQAVIAVKIRYEGAVAALSDAAAGTGVGLHLMKSTYPSGDEQTLVYDVTGRVVPTGGLPLDVGALVCNVSTLLNVSAAMEGRAVTDKTVTVTGAVKRPITLSAPIGAPIAALIDAAGGFERGDAGDYEIIIGGPLMGFVTGDLSLPVTKTTGGIIPLPKGHRLLRYKRLDLDRQAKLARAVCCQCSVCTQLCPRAALGLGVEPHKAMRVLSAEKGSLLGDYNGVFSCCDCGVCTYYACNFGLSPSLVMGALKKTLAGQGVKPQKRVAKPADPGLKNKKLPLGRLVSRLGLDPYDRDAPLGEPLEGVETVRIPLKMHIGAPCKPVVDRGRAVEKGTPIALPEGLGAPVHASIRGVVREVNSRYIEIRAVGCAASNRGGKG
jgi:Na+-translocating ferredoxin:NAD+ oxidoreductase RnfC subunit